MYTYVGYEGQDVLEYVQEHLNNDDINTGETEPWNPRTIEFWKEELKAMGLREGDQIRSWSDVRGPLAGQGGLAIVREGKVVDQMATWIS